MRKVHYHPSANIPHNDQYRSRQSNIKSHLKALCITIVYTWPVVAQFQQKRSELFSPTAHCPSPGKYSFVFFVVFSRLEKGGWRVV